MPGGTNGSELGRPLSTARVAAIIVAYNCAGLLQECLRELIGETLPWWLEITVVDNASHDQVGEMLRTEFPMVRFIHNDTNLGFACAVNQGIRSAAPDAHILLLNPDARLHCTALRSLLDFMQRTPRAGAVAPRLYGPCGVMHHTARTFPSPWVALIGRKSVLLRWFPQNPISRRYLLDRAHSGTEPSVVDWVAGGCVLLHRDAVREVGLLDEGFFMYWEDADWCRRCKSAGWLVFCAPAIHAVHLEGASGGVPARLAWEFHRSALRYYTKHHLRRLARVLIPLAALVLFVRCALIITRGSVQAALWGPTMRRNEHQGRGHER